MPVPVTDPATLEAIDMEFAAAVYRAQREARLRYLGLMPPPVPSDEARRLWPRIMGRVTQPAPYRP